MTLSPKSIRILRRVLLGTAVLVTLLVTAVTVETWRGDRAWAEVEREYQAKGESLTLRGLAQPPVPEQENFFKAPLLARVLYNPSSDDKRKLLAETHLREFYFSAHTRTATMDLTAWRDVFVRIHRPDTVAGEAPAAAVLRALLPLRPLLDELRVAARTRPGARLDSGGLPFEPPALDASVVRDLAEALVLRASAALALGRTDEAFADTFAALRLANGIAKVPQRLGILLGESLLGAATRPILEGRQRHAWSEAQLAAFQAQLGELRPLAAYDRMLRAERAFAIQFVDTAPDFSPARAADRFHWQRWLLHGWAQQNKVAVYRHFEADVWSTFTVEPERILPDRVARAEASTRALTASNSPYSWVARQAVNHLVVILNGVGRTADTITLTAVACAMERYRLAHGQYPEKLDTLVPAYLPAVPTGRFDGLPVKYVVRIAEGDRQLYFFGPNGRDDAGHADDIVLLLSENT